MARRVAELPKGTRLGGFRAGQITLAKEVVNHLQASMLCLADRNFLGFELWQRARATGADLLWRAKKHLLLACGNRLPDEPYLSRIYPSWRETIAWRFTSQSPG